jgi:hypothetical protein
MHKKQLPLYAAYVMDNHGKLFSAALRNSVLGQRLWSPPA